MSARIGFTKLNNNEKDMHYLAVDINEESIDDSIFIIPQGYQEMTAEMKAMMGMGN